MRRGAIPNTLDTALQENALAAGPWIVVVLGFLALALAYSARAALGLMMPVWAEELQWSRSFVSGSAATALVVMAILAPVGGRLVDLHGPGRVLIYGLGALAAGCFAVAAASNQVVFLIAFGGISAVGFGLLATHVVSTAVEQRDVRNPGLAIGAATSGSSAGQFLILPLIAVLLTAVSWRWSYLALGVASLVMVWAVRRWLPKGPVGCARANNRRALAADLVFILKKPAFHSLFWSYFLCGYTTTGVIETHFLPYAAFCGFAPVPSATAYGLLSAVNLAGMILAGWLTDRMHRPLLLAIIYLVRGVSFVLLVQIGASVELLLLFAVLFGLVDYSTVPATASLVASHIGLRVTGLAFGLISAGHSIGGALGAFLGGVLFDLYARYDWVWWSSLWLSVLAGMLVLLLREDRPRLGAIVGGAGQI